MKTTKAIYASRENKNMLSEEIHFLRFCVRNEAYHDKYIHRINNTVTQ